MPNTITDTITELADNKSDIQDALVAKGVTSAGKHGFNKFAEDISAIYTFTPTQAQLDAMNSGITAAGVQQITTNETNILNIQAQPKLYVDDSGYIAVNYGSEN